MINLINKSVPDLFHSWTLLKKMRTLARDLTRVRGIFLDYGDSSYCTFEGDIYINSNVNLKEISDDTKLLVILATVVHECGHYIFTFELTSDSKEKVEEIEAELEKASVSRSREVLMDIWNIFEDRYIERMICQDYTGFEEAIRDMNNLYMERYDLDSILTDSPYKQWDKLTLAYAVGYRDFSEDFSQVEEMKEVLEVFEETKFMLDTNEPESSLDAIMLSVQIYDLLEQHNMLPEKGERGYTLGGGSIGKDGGIKPVPIKVKDGNSTNGKQKGFGEDKEFSDSDSTTEALKNAYNKEMKDQEKINKKREQQMKTVGNGSAGSSFTIDVLTDIESQINQERVERAKPISKKMNAKFQAMFSIDDEQWVPFQKSGRITNINRVFTDRLIFSKKRVEVGEWRPSIAIVIDESGSMGHIEQDIKDLLMVLYIFCKENDIELAVFSHEAFGGEDRVSIKPLKWFDDADIHVESYRPWGNTRDGVVLEWVTNYVNSFAQNENRWVFVISDGNPWHSGKSRDSNYGGMVAIEDVKEKVGKMEALGMFVYGIGLGLDISALYPNSIRVDNVSELPDVLYKNIKRKMSVI